MINYICKESNIHICFIFTFTLINFIKIYLLPISKKFYYQVTYIVKINIKFFFLHICLQLIFLHLTIGKCVVSNVFIFNIIFFYRN